MNAGIDIRAYVVGFGDCVLLSLPDDKRLRHVLVDFGRAPNDSASLGRFPAIANDIAERCEGRLDLIVVTHEHLDHLEGFYREREVFDRIDVEQVWMGLPSDENYYANYPGARLQKRVREAVGEFALHADRKGIALHPAFRSLLQNNLANADRIDYLRKLGRKPPLYLARGKTGSAATRWSRHIKVRVLAPEEDTSTYYGRSGRSRALMSELTKGLRGAAADGAIAKTSKEGSAWDFANVPRAVDGDLEGFSASDYGRLRRAIREDGVAAARFIDRAANNTSLCLLLQAAGKRLLLPGDAELESWDKIRENCAKDLAPVDFLKVSHHGSHNGTPPDLLDTLLPVRRADRAKILVSTKRDVYGTKNPVPDKSLLAELKRRCAQLVTTDGVPGTHVDLRV